MVKDMIDVMYAVWDDVYQVDHIIYIRVTPWGKGLYLNTSWEMVEDLIDIHCKRLMYCVKGDTYQVDNIFIYKWPVYVELYEVEDML